jgi:hypothetical protein
MSRQEARCGIFGVVVESDILGVRESSRHWFAPLLKLAALSNWQERMCRDVCGVRMYIRHYIE